MTLSPLEQQVLEKLLAGIHPLFPLLRDQLAKTMVTEREFTGVGFFTTLAVAPEVPRLSPSQSFAFGDVGATIPGLDAGAGFVLFIADGALHLLEGYSYDEPWPDSAESFELAYLNPTRDFTGLPQLR
jgi:hypothetical protein